MQKKSLLNCLILFLCAIVLVLPGCGRKKAPHDTRLIVYLIADQFSQEYLHRFHPFLSGGILRLIEKGTVFQEAYFDHAATMTAPGHASLATGFHPSRHGVIANDWFDRRAGRGRYCIEDDRYQKSPRSMLVPAFGDWLKESYSGAKVFSVSGKDRSAILMGGQNADAAYWYNKQNGGVTSSTYYRQHSPGWLKRFNGQDLLKRHFASVWKPIQIDRALRTQAEVVELDKGFFQDDFPHPLGPPALYRSEAFYDAIYGTPYLDRYMLEFTEELVKRESLGKDATPDMLALSLSALDTVGHRYGPNSPEVLDTILRLDRELEKFFKFLDERIGLEHVMIVFSSDHGIQPFPEYREFSGQQGHRFDTSDVQCIQQAGLSAMEHYGVDDLFLDSFYLNYSSLKKNKISRDDIETRMKGWIEQCDTIERVWISSRLFHPETLQAPYALNYGRSFHPERSPDFLIQPKPFVLASHSGTNHGTPYSYDAHVPVIFMGSGISAGSIHERISIVDLPVTLADLLEIETMDKPDGKSQLDLLLRKDQGGADTENKS